MISVVCPSIRLGLRRRIVENLSNAKTDYEIIFLGPGKSSENLGSKVREIYVPDEIKPVQCWAYGVHISEGDLVGILADDIFMDSEEGPVLDVIDRTYRRECSDRAVVGFTHHPSNPYPPHWFVRPNDRTSEKMSPIQFYSRALFEESGGPDIRFIAGQADVEMWNRMNKYHKGYLVFSSAYFWEDDSRWIKTGSRLRYIHKKDQETRNKMMRVNRHYTGALIDPLQPYNFDRDDFLDVNQGEVGDKWYSKPRGVI